jgi:hypothetical protein
LVYIDAYVDLLLEENIVRSLKSSAKMVQQNNSNSSCIITFSKTNHEIYTHESGGTNGHKKSDSLEVGFRPCYVKPEVGLRPCHALVTHQRWDLTCRICSPNFWRFFCTEIELTRRNRAAAHTASAAAN